MGDLLQDYVTIKLIDRNIPDSNFVFATPGYEVALLTQLQNVSMTPSLSELTSFGHLTRALRSLASGNLPDVEPRGSRKHGGMLPEPKDVAMSILKKRYHESSCAIRCIRPAIARATLKRSFDATTIPGHTIEKSAFFEYVMTYSTSRAMTNGPVITFPISISRTALGQSKTRERLLKHSLQRLDTVFVRGPYSFELLSNYMDSKRIMMAPDSGFAIKSLHSLRTTKKKDGAIRLAIIPRKDYHVTHGKLELYKTYVDVLAKLVSWLIQTLAAEVHLVPHTIRDGDHSGLDDVSAIEDLLGHFESETKTGQLKVFHPKSPLDTYRLFSQMDLVVTSRMHAGVLAMSAGSVAFFLIPSEDVKVLDIMSSLGLDSTDFIIDMFDTRQFTFGNIRDKVKVLLDQNTEFTKRVTSGVDRVMPQVELPARTLSQLLR
jgi:polysaccharide pyruvyl transferase WcaK-like protein